MILGNFNLFFLYMNTFQFYRVQFGTDFEMLHTQGTTLLHFNFECLIHGWTFFIVSNSWMGVLTVFRVEKSCQPKRQVLKS